MVILHIASIDDSLYSGVCVVVPQHILHQQILVDVGFVNVRNVKIEGIKNQFEFRKKFNVSDLPKPFLEPDLVVFHEVYRPAFLKIANDLSKRRVPYIIIPHGSLTREVQSQRKLKKMIGNFLLFNKFIKGAKAIQCLSENEMSRIDFVVEKFVCPTGIEMPKKCKERFSENTVNINYIGRLEMYTKGLDIMAKAVAINAEYLRENNYKINIYGPDMCGNRKAFRNLCLKLGIEDVLLLKDAVYDKEKEKLLLETDIFIQTSRTEGMPMGILEALSYGVPCLVTKGTTWGDYITKYDAGWVAENNAESVAEKLMLALQQKELWVKKSEGAKRLVEKEFRWDAQIEFVIEKYKNLK